MTLANEQRLYCGSTDLPLSDAGREGILSRKAQGLYPPATGLKLYSSGLLRTRQTLALIYGDQPQTALPGLAEMDFGAFEMQSYEQLKEDPAYQRWITDRSGTLACPNGESADAFAQRVFAAFDSLAARGEPAMVCTHGGVIARIMQRLFPLEPKHFYLWQPRPGEGYALCIRGGQAPGYQAVTSALDQGQ